MTTRSTTKYILCAHCGKKRGARYIRFMGKEHFTGYEPCDCDGYLDDVKAKEKADAEELEKKKRDLDERRLEKAGIPKRYRHDYHEKAHELANSVESINSWVYIHGKNGTLKSTLAYCIAAELVNRYHDVFCVSSYDLMDAMRSPVDRDKAIYERAKNCEVLVIDDLGKEATASAYACERLFAIIDYRSKELKPVIITSNYKLSDISSKISIGGVGVAIASRIREDAVMVELGGKDRRLKC